jgi:hypothetical protein
MEIENLGGRTQEQYLRESNERLKNICTKKVDTTMIGALDIISKEIDELTRNLSESDSITLHEAYSRMRSKILDNGNNQKRALKEEFKHYTIRWNMYSMSMQFKQREQSPSGDFVIVNKEGK